jgi:hypothetical protein
MNWRKVVVLLFAVCATVLVVRRLGEIADPQGESNSNCDVIERSTVPNGAGMEVSIHTTVCTTLGTSLGTYVHVHPTGVPESRNTLAFRFSPDPMLVEPRVEWVSREHIRISIKHVSQISKQEAVIGDVKIEYVVGTQDYPPTHAAGPFSHSGKPNVTK